MRGRDDCADPAASSSYAAAGSKPLPVAGNPINSRLMGKLEGSSPVRGSPVSGSPLLSNSPLSGSPSRSRTMTRTQSKRSLVTNSTKDAGRTPQTKRKELSLGGGQRDSPGGSPRNTNPRTTTKRTRKSQDHDVGDPPKKSSVSSRPRGGRNSTTQAVINRRASTTNQPALTVSITPAAGAGGTTNVPLSTYEDLEERAKFDKLWEVKSVDMGRVRIPPNVLDDLIRKEHIEKFYVIEDKPVAR